MASGRDTYFSNEKNLDSFLRPIKNIVKRDVEKIEQNVGVNLTVKNSRPMKELVSENPEMPYMRNLNMSKKKDEMSFCLKKPGDFYVDIWAEAKKCDVEKSNNVKKFEKHKNQETYNTQNEEKTNFNKINRIKNISNSISMKGLLQNNADEKHFAKKNVVDIKTLVEATKNSAPSEFKNQSHKYKHYTKNGQVFYIE